MTKRNSLLIKFLPKGVSDIDYIEEQRESIIVCLKSGLKYLITPFGDAIKIN